MKKQYNIFQTVFLTSLFAFLLWGISFAQIDPFITVWDTENYGSSNNNQIKVPATGDWDYDWEEVGNPSNNGGSGTPASGETTITFGQPGIYRLKIFPNNYNSTPFNQIQFAGQDDNYKLIDIEHWGDVQWSSFHKAFSMCTNLIGSATDVPNLTLVTDMEAMFNGTLDFTGDVIGWDVSNVTNMIRMFNGAQKFNGDVTDWDVGNVTNMERMFNSAKKFNGNVSGWNVSKVTNMEYMFSDAFEFNKDINGWDVSKVTDMNSMFMGLNGTLIFNQDLNSWDVSKVTDMSSMFSRAEDFNGDVSSWNVGLVTDMSDMFHGAINFEQDLSSWVVSNVTDMSYMFKGASSITNIGPAEGDIHAKANGVDNWDVSQVVNMEGMFSNAIQFNGDIGNWDVGQVTNMEGMFSNAIQFNGDIGNWDVGQVVSMADMFLDATQFNRDLGNWTVSMLGIFNNGTYNDISFKESGLSDINYSKIIRGWAENPNTADGVIMEATDLDYCQNIEHLRDSLIDVLNWEIRDDNKGNCILSIDNLMVTDFTVYPNPAQQQITIDGLNGMEKIQLTDMTGRVLLTVRNIGNASSTLQIEELANGIYNLVIQEKGNQIVKKVVKR